MFRASVLAVLLTAFSWGVAHAQANAGECAGVISGGSSCGGSGSTNEGGGTGNRGGVNTLALQNAQRFLASAQCNNPGAAACRRSFASWYNCIAYNSGNNSCGPRPSCSVVCSATSEGAVFPPISSSNRKIDQVNDLMNVGFQLFSLFHKDNPGPQSTNNADNDFQPDPEAEAAARQQAINTEAANLLESAKAVLPNLSSASGTQLNPNARLTALLDDGPPSNAGTVAMDSLLEGSASQGSVDSVATTAMNNLLAKNVSPPPAVNVVPDPNAPRPGDPFYQPPAPDPSQWYTPPAPLQDQEMNADLQDSVDRPNPSMFAALKQTINFGMIRGEQGLKDELNNLVVAPVQSLISPVIDDRGIQWLMNTQGLCTVCERFTTMPTAVRSDSPDTMANLTIGQGAVGLGDIVKGPNGVGSALNKMTTQANADVDYGWANTSEQQQ